MSSITSDEIQQAAEKLIPRIKELQRQALDLEASRQGELADLPPESLASGRNLLHYLALRRTDLRHLQRQLADLGLSSLDGMEPRVMCTLNGVQRALHILAGEYLDQAEVPVPPVNFTTGPGTLERNAQSLLDEDGFLPQSHFENRHDGSAGMVVKIDSQKAFDDLPDLLLAALRTPPPGVTVLKEDLAAEVGLERLSDMQEEIVRLCEAAHVPVIVMAQAPADLSTLRAGPVEAGECAAFNSQGAHFVQFLGGILARFELRYAGWHHQPQRLAIS